MKRFLTTVLIMMLVGCSAFAYGAEARYNDDYNNYIYIYKEGDDLHDAYDWYWEKDLSREKDLITFYWTYIGTNHIFPGSDSFGDLPKDFVKILYTGTVPDSNIPYWVECLKLGDTCHIYFTINNVYALKTFENELSANRAYIVRSRY